MSYDFYLGRPQDPSDPAKAILDGAVAALGTHEEVWKKIEELIGPVRWRRDDTGRHPWSTMGPYQGSDTWYEIPLHHDPVLALSVRTSHGASTRELVPRLCELLGVHATTRRSARSQRDLRFRPGNLSGLSG